MAFESTDTVLSDQREPGAVGLYKCHWSCFVVNVILFSCGRRDESDTQASIELEVSIWRAQAASRDMIGKMYDIDPYVVGRLYIVDICTCQMRLFSVLTFS